MSYVDDKRKTYEVAVEYVVRLSYFAKGHSHEEALEKCKHQDFDIVDKSNDDVDYTGSEVAYILDDQEIIDDVEDK